MFHTPFVKLNFSTKTISAKSVTIIINCSQSFAESKDTKDKLDTNVPYLQASRWIKTDFLSINLELVSNNYCLYFRYDSATTSTYCNTFSAIGNLSSMHLFLRYSVNRMNSLGLVPEMIRERFLSHRFTAKKGSSKNSALSLFASLVTLRKMGTQHYINCSQMVQVAQYSWTSSVKIHLMNESSLK